MNAAFGLENFGRKSSLYDRVDRAGYLALRTLDRLGPTTARGLAGALHLDSSTVARQVATLMQVGLLERRSDPVDGRSWTLVLTSEGRKVMRRMEQDRRNQIERLTHRWSSSDRRHVARSLALLNDSLVEAVAAGPSPSVDAAASGSSGTLRSHGDDRNAQRSRPVESLSLPARSLSPGTVARGAVASGED